MHTIVVFIGNHPLLCIFSYFQIGIICAVIYSIIAHIYHLTDIDNDNEFFGLVISFIFLWPILLVFVIPVCILSFIKIIGETVANLIKGDE